MSMTTLFRKLREHELNLERLNEKEDQGRKNNRSFKFEVVKSKSSKDDDFDNEIMSLKIMKFTKFMEAKGKVVHPLCDSNEVFISCGFRELSFISYGFKKDVFFPKLILM